HPSDLLGDTRLQHGLVATPSRVTGVDHCGVHGCVRFLTGLDEVVIPRLAHLLDLAVPARLIENRLQFPVTPALLTDRHPGSVLQDLPRDEDRSVDPEGEKRVLQGNVVALSDEELHQTLRFLRLGLRTLRADPRGPDDTLLVTRCLDQLHRDLVGELDFLHRLTSLNPCEPAYIPIGDSTGSFEYQYWIIRPHPSH